MLITAVRHILQSRYFSNLSASLMLVLLAACANTPDSAPSSAVSADIGLLIKPPATVVLLPVRSISAQMRDGIDTIQLAAQNTLTQIGYDVFVVKARTYKQLREEALAVSGSIYSPDVGQFVPLDDDVYMQSMLSQIQAVADVDALVKVDLQLRDVANTGELVTWDNTRAKLEVINTRSVVYAAPTALKGLSFQISAFDAEGRKQFASRQGFALPYRLHVSEEVAEFQVRDDLFSDIGELEQVMRQAMQPQAPAQIAEPGTIAVR